MKSPPRQFHDDEARERVEAFIQGEDIETLQGTEQNAATAAGSMSTEPRVPGDPARATGVAPRRRTERAAAG